MAAARSRFMARDRLMLRACGLSKRQSRLDTDGQPVFLPGQLAKVAFDLDAVPELV